MYEGKNLAVVVPAYNEEKCIAKVIETMPNFVDLIIVVNDASTDETLKILEYFRGRIRQSLEIINHIENQGVGAAIINGYKRALDREMDIVAVMAGDAQMDPDELEKIILPVAKEEVDYTKGNRFFSGDAWKVIPMIRYFAGIFLSFLTKIVSGYWHVSDSQCGYTAISRYALELINLDNIYKRYGFPNDILTELNIYNLRVKDIPVKPIYNVGEVSGIKYERIIFTLSWLLWRLFFYRMWHKYVIRDFHPLVLFYFFGSLFLSIGFILGLFIYIMKGNPGLTIVVFCAILLISGLQFLLFAMWFDMEYNKPFCIK